MKRYLILIIISMLLGSCALIPSTQSTEVQSTAVRKVATASPEVAAITFKRSGGLAGKTEQWSFYSDGRVVSDQGTTQVLPGDVSGMVAGLTALGIYDLKDSYGGLTNCNDCFTYTISITGEGKTKTITTTDGATDTPVELETILKLINDFINKVPTQ
jgi:hypothetical protein